MTGFETRTTTAPRRARKSPADVRQPLDREAGPLQRVRHHQVVQEGRVLLPDLVLLVDDPLLHRVIVDFGRNRTMRAASQTILSPD